MFTIGQKVVCVQGKSSACGRRLIDGKIYTVNAIRRCRCSSVLDVGIRISTENKCFKCNTLLSKDGTWWLYAWRFIPLDEWQEADENVKQLMEEVNNQVPKYEVKKMI